MPFDYKVLPSVNGVNVALDGHTHEGAGVHDHDADYSPIGHTHAYAPDPHDHFGYADIGHNHTGEYAEFAHLHDYEPLGHNHNGVYAPDAHVHDELYAGLAHTHAYALDPHDHNGVHAPTVHTHVESDITDLQAYLTAATADLLYAPISHNHDDRYYTETELQTPGSAEVDWENIVNRPATGYFFLHEDASDIAATDLLLETPAGGVEEIDSVTITAASGHVLLSRYITENMAGWGYTRIPAGVWNFSLYAYTSSLTGGDSRIHTHIYKRNQAGVETQLFSAYTTLTSTSVTLHELSVVQPEITLDATDRLVLVLHAETTRVPNTTISFVHEGLTHDSHFHFPILGAGMGDMLRSIYDADLDGIVDAAETVPWAGVSGVPATFPPSAHSHTLDDLSNVYVPTPLDGQVLKWVDANNRWEAGTDLTAEGGEGVTDHGLLTGLGDDDHSQYHTDARGDARYSPLGHTHSYAPDPHDHNLVYAPIVHDHNHDDLSGIDGGGPGYNHLSDVEYEELASGSTIPTQLHMHDRLWVDSGLGWTYVTVTETNISIGVQGTFKFFVDENGAYTNGDLGVAGEIYTPSIRAASVSGLGIEDDGNNLAIFIEDGGNVGIRNANPAYALDVTGSAAVSGTIYAPTLAAPSAAGMRIEDDGSNLGIFVEDGGFVGIRNTNPAYALDVTGSAAVSDNFYAKSVTATQTNSGSPSVTLASADYGAAGTFGPWMQIGYNSNATFPAAGWIRMYTRAGTYRSIWFDTDGNMRFGNVVPSYANDAAGSEIAIRNGANTFSAAQRIDASGNALTIAAAAAGQHAYASFYPDSFASGRKGYMGYGTNGSVELNISNEYTTGKVNILNNAKTGLSVLSTGEVQFPTGLVMDEVVATPANPTASNQIKVYMKADRFVIAYLDVAQIRYKSLLLTGTGVTWTHSTTPP